MKDFDNWNNLKKQIEIENAKDFISFKKGVVGLATPFFYDSIKSYLL